MADDSSAWSYVAATLREIESGRCSITEDMIATTGAIETREVLQGLARMHRERLFLESIVENIPNMIFVKEAGELRFARFNRAGEELLGYQRDALLGKNDYDFFPPEEADFFIAKDREVLDGGELVDIAEEPIHTAHRGVRYLHTQKIPILGDDGTPLYLLGISEDITDRKRVRDDLERARRELIMSEARLRVLLEHFPGLLWTVDESFVFLTVAGARAGSFGLDPDDVIGRTLSELDVSEAAIEAHEAAAAGRVATYEYRFGGRILEVRVEPMGLPNVAVIGVAMDVTERRRVQAEAIRAKLQKAHKMESLGVLAGGIAHDFNNLLVGILGNASHAQEMVQDDPQLVELLGRIEMSARRAAELTEQMLAYSGRGQFVVEAVDVRTLVEEMRSLLAASIPKLIAIRVELPDEQCAVEADVAQLRRVILNLATNAADAIGERAGRISISVRVVAPEPAELEAPYLTEPLSPGRYIELTVIDDGAGMSEDTRARMFDPFFTTKADGHGLGLAAAQGIVRAHAGLLAVRSDLGVGTRVRLLLPATRLVPKRRPAEVQVVAAPPGTTILIVDDEAVILDVATAVLAADGYTVLAVSDGYAAVDRVRAELGSIDLVVLDMTMPQISGADTLAAIRELEPDLPILLSSGYTQRDAMARIGAAPRVAFLKKPYTAPELLAGVQRLLSPA